MMEPEEGAGDLPVVFVTAEVPGAEEGAGDLPVVFVTAEVPGAEEADPLDLNLALP
jgi:hypothetical protein